MNVTLTGELAEFVSQKVATGEYAMPSEVIEDALRLLREQDGKREQLRQEIAAGTAEANEGKVAPLNAAQTLARIRQGRADPTKEAS